MRTRALRTICALGGAAAIIAVTPSIGFAQEGPDTQAILDNLWVFLAGALVFFMQAGFALVEAGLTRAKNVVNIFAKNLSDALIGVLAFFACGYAFAFGSVSDSGVEKFIGTKAFFLSGQDMSIPVDGGLSTATVFFFQVVFAATAVTIISGAMAERTKFISYLILSFAMTAFIYPVVVHWTWGGGFIAQLHVGDAVFSDFAGSGVVHMVGGIGALMGAYFLGPRIGKYGPDGKPRAIPGHNVPFVVLGVFILWLGWFGFNPGSELAADGAVITVAVNTLVAACAAGVACTITIWLVSGKPDLTMICNGVLAGLVAITAPCGTVNAGMSVIIGAIAGVLVVFAVFFFDKIKIDDPVGAVSVHGVCGMWGVLSVGLFAQYPDAFVEARLGDAYTPSGLFYGGGFEQLGIQALMVLIIGVWVTATSSIVFLALKATIGLRVTAEEEIEGLDFLEHGNEGYAPDMVSSTSGAAQR